MSDRMSGVADFQWGDVLFRTIRWRNEKRTLMCSARVGTGAPWLIDLAADEPVDKSMCFTQTLSSLIR